MNHSSPHAGCFSALMLAVMMYLGVAEAQRPVAQAGERVVVQVAPGVEMAFRWIPAGTFTMGSPDDEQHRFDWEGPQTQVTLTQGFWMGETEVTQAQWRAVMGADPLNLAFPGNPNNPMERVSWDDIMGAQVSGRPTPQVGSFMARLRERTGLNATLPTEAQWEYACRAGTTTRWSFGDNESALGNKAWYVGNSSARTQPVGQKQANAWGLHDMHGNVNEWCLDWMDAYPGGATDDYSGPSSGTGRVCRGGSSFLRPRGLRSAGRHWFSPCYRGNFSGFRVVCVPEEEGLGIGD